jgi:hypothetical protein
MIEQFIESLKPREKPKENFVSIVKDNSEKERLDTLKEQEKAKKEAELREKLENERLERERVENERLERERAENKRLERERVENERLEQERVENERLERERVEKERLAKERIVDDEIIEEESREVIAPLKEVISVEKNIDDTETVDDFFNDVSKLMENKGIKVEKDAKKYTLFDDADDNE